MPSPRTLPVLRSATLVCALALFCAAMAMPFARKADASYYNMVLCSGANGAIASGTATNTTSPTNPGGIFAMHDWCGGVENRYPAGNAWFLRIAELADSGSAGVGAFGRIYWTSPGFVMISGAGGYTRYPAYFADGWRGVFWAEGYDGSQNNILMQGSGVANGSCGGVCWNTTPVFASHLWPFGSYGSYRSFVFEMRCVRPAGCDRTNYNTVEANSFQLVLNDVSPAVATFTGSAGIMGQNWVRGTHTVTWNISDLGSGLRWERLRVDGGQRYVLDHAPACKLGATGATGEFARVFQPCPTGGPYAHKTTLDTTGVADGSHTMSICAQDYGQAVGLSGSGGESCDQRQIKTDNRPPAAPGGLAIVTANPARYVEDFGARWTLPPDPGSPIAKVHYVVVDESGAVVVPEKILTGTNPTQIARIEGPEAPGDYRLRVWLEDSVGFTGPAASVPVPRDTTPPAAPQDLSVTAPSTARSADGFDVRWRNLTDAGAPIDAVHYQVLDAGGEVVVPTRHLRGADPQAIQILETPRDSGGYTLRLWLSDAEGNVGAPASAPLAYSCGRSQAAGGSDLAAGLGGGTDRVVTVPQGRGSHLSGSLKGSRGSVAGAPVCMFSRVVTDPHSGFLGVAMTGPGGEYGFPVAAGPSRELTAMYRSDHREIRAKATVLTRVKPVFKVGRRVVRNKHTARFFVRIPGPHSDRVVIAFQVKSGKGWRAFRRCRTRAGGRCEVIYRFTRTTRPTEYVMRAQVRAQGGYPFEPGNSAPLRLKVVP